MDLIDRYVYAVIRSFDKKQREDIEMELRVNIEDMIEQNKVAESYEEKVKKVLLELGDPEELANNYRGSERCLIGPQYYDMYILLLKIVLGAVFGGISIAIFVQSLFTANINIGNVVANYFSSLFSGILQAFAWTTLAFIIAERKNKKMSDYLSGKNKWDLSQLPPVPDKKAEISLSEPIFSIIFTTIFMVILFSAPELFAAYIQNGSSTAIIPVFNVKVIEEYKTLIVIIFVLSILREILKLYYRRWKLKLSVIYVILTVISTGFVLIIFTNNSIWNPYFSTEIIKYMKLTFDFAGLWEQIKIWIAFAIVLACSVDIAAALYKGIRYNTRMAAI
jgi:hypothetical protein